MLNKQMTLEQKIVEKYAPNSCLLELVLESYDKCNRFITVLEEKIKQRDFCHKLILQHPVEALLSPVKWIRDEAAIVLKTNS